MCNLELRRGLLGCKERLCISCPPPSCTKEEENHQPYVTEKLTAANKQNNERAHIKKFTDFRIGNLLTVIKSRLYVLDCAASKPSHIIFFFYHGDVSLSRPLFVRRWLYSAGKQNLQFLLFFCMLAEERTGSMHSCEEAQSWMATVV